MSKNGKLGSQIFSARNNGARALSRLNKGLMRKALWERPDYRADWKSWTLVGRHSAVLPEDPLKGLTLRQAMHYFGEERTIKRLLDAENILLARDAFNFSSAVINICRSRTELEGLVLQRLYKGTIAATGYSKYNPYNEPASSIIPDRWRFLKANLDKIVCLCAGGTDHRDPAV